MDDVFTCGNDLRFLEWWLNHHGGDPRFKGVIKELAAVTQGLVQVLTSSQITNHALARELKAETTKQFIGAANRLVTLETSKAAA